MTDPAESWKRQYEGQRSTTRLLAVVLLGFVVFSFVNRYMYDRRIGAVCDQVGLAYDKAAGVLIERYDPGTLANAKSNEIVKTWQALEEGRRADPLYEVMRAAERAYDLCPSVTQDGPDR